MPRLRRIRRDRARQRGEDALDPRQQEEISKKPVTSIDNESNGTVYGPVVQVGSLQGNVHLHQPSNRLASHPRQLPASNPRLPGRSSEIEALNSMIYTPGDHRGSVQLVTIDGLAGVGKTSLAVNWAHAVADRFPDGQL